MVISGMPAAGKTSVARLLAARCDGGVHIETDVFFGFISHMADPSAPGSEAQNETVVRAYCRAAGSYRQSGYAVFMDGVIGPWFFPVIAAELGEFDYVLLDVSLRSARQRNRSRSVPIDPVVIGRMAPQFVRAAADYAQHVVSTGNAGIEEVANLIGETRADGRYIIAAS